MVAVAEPRRRYVVDTHAALHGKMVEFWERQGTRARVPIRFFRAYARKILERDYYQASRRFKTRFERIVEDAESKGECSGDATIARIRDTFHNGLGVRWGEDQVRVFNAFIFSCLPLIYGEEWAENKARILEEWNAQRECPYTVVSMARRNGKTFVTSGTVVALLLCVPRIKVAIFSTCKRTSQMMMSAAVDMLEQAFEKGTHCNRHDFVQVARNTESIMLEGPDRTKRLLGCFPGSVRVRVSTHSLFSTG